MSIELVYFDITQKYKNIINAFQTYYETGYRDKYLTRSYIDQVISEINNWIDNVPTNNYISYTQYIYNLRQIERKLFAMKRINQLFTNNTIDQAIADLNSRLIDNFVFPN